MRSKNGKISEEVVILKEEIEELSQILRVNGIEHPREELTLARPHKEGAPVRSPRGRSLLRGG